MGKRERKTKASVKSEWKRRNNGKKEEKDLMIKGRGKSKCVSVESKWEEEGKEREGKERELIT